MYFATLHRSDAQLVMFDHGLYNRGLIVHNISLCESKSFFVLSG